MEEINLFSTFLARKLRIQIDPKSKERGDPELYNLADDLPESNNLALQMPRR